MGTEIHAFVEYDLGESEPFSEPGNVRSFNSGEFFIRSDYTGVKIGMDEGLQFDFKAQLSYGGFDLDTENVNYIKKIVKSNSKYYEGYVGSENSGPMVDVEADYGSIKMYSY